MNSWDQNNIDFKDLDVDVSHTSIEKKEKERIDFIPPVSCSELVELSWKGKFEMDKIALVNETTAAVDDNKFLSKSGRISCLDSQLSMHKFLTFAK